VKQFDSEKIKSVELFGMLWRMIHMTVHRYDTNPTGEALVVMTILLLDQLDCSPTISELTEITGLQKSSVSRYVSRQLDRGHLSEVIDPEDRRRRYLCPTSAGGKEQQWYKDQVRELANMAEQIVHGMGESGDPGEDLKKILLDITRRDVKQS
jgi:DNA-binding MarR family transcriptional regulator